MFIDNLPNEEREINVMLRQVKKHIKDLEKQFFLEEDSEQEEDLKREFSNPLSEDYDERLEKIREKTHIKAFWSIPLSVNVKGLEF